MQTNIIKFNIKVNKIFQFDSQKTIKKKDIETFHLTPGLQWPWDQYHTNVSTSRVNLF